MQCSSCGAPNDAGARFCSSCGRPAVAPAAAAPAAAPPRAQVTPNYPQSGLRMCASCGANVPPSTPTCGACGAAPSPNLSLPMPQHGVNWVLMRVQFGCVQCGEKSPVNHLDVDGRYFCVSCQQDRQFDVDLWHEKIVPLAAATGDHFWSNTRIFPPWPTVVPDTDWFEEQEAWSNLADALPQLLSEFFPRIGIERPRLRAEQEGTVMSAGGVKTATYKVELYPGHPLCPQCKLPFEVQFPERGRAVIRCPGCGMTEAHRTPPEALAKCPDVLAALAPDHVEGRAAARLEPKAGTAALGVMCPQCGSALQLTPGNRLCKCSYCGTSSLVPDRVAGATASEPAPWWLAVYSPSTLRRTLLAPNAGKKPAEDPDWD